MKAYTHTTDDYGNAYEEELGEVAIFATLEEIQELIDFLTYVKEDHTVQHRDNGIEMTHSHFNMWKGKETGPLDLQIWSSARDWSKVNPDLYAVAKYFLAFELEFSDGGDSVRITNPLGKGHISVCLENDPHTPYAVYFSFQHRHLATAAEAQKYVEDIMSDRMFAIELFKDGRRLFGGDLNAQELRELSYQTLADKFSAVGEIRLIDRADSFKVRGWEPGADFDAVFVTDENGNVTIQKLDM